MCCIWIFKSCASHPWSILVWPSHLFFGASSVVPNQRGWGALRQLREDEAHGPHVALLGEALIGSGWSGGHADASVLGRGRSQVAGKSRDTTRLADANRCHIYRIFHLHFPGRSCKKFCVGTVLPINTAECTIRTLYLCRGQSPDTCSSWDQNALRWGTQRCGLYMPLYCLLLQRFVLSSGDTKYHAFQCWTKVQVDHLHWHTALSLADVPTHCKELANTTGRKATWGAFSEAKESKQDADGCRCRFLRLLYAWCASVLCQVEILRSLTKGAKGVLDFQANVMLFNTKCSVKLF